MPSRSSPAITAPAHRHRDGPPLRMVDADARTVDDLVARVTSRLRRARTPLPDERLRRLAEELVLDATRFALDWVESPPGRDADP